MDDVWKDYRDKMNHLANALYAESEYLKKLAGCCNQVSEECQEVADSIDSAIGSLRRGEISENAITLQ